MTTSNLRSGGSPDALAPATTTSRTGRRAARDSEPPSSAGRTAASAPLIVTGMHRSGTSLAASVLRSGGVSMGDRLMPPHPSNPEGFFEDLDFVELHMDALARKGLDPDGWEPREVGAVDDALAARARELVDRKSSRGPWGWKDPRTVLFLPFWVRALPKARFVFLFRTPWDVLDSLFRRGDAAVRDRPERFAEIWTAYNRRILQFVERERGRSLLFDADAVAADPGGFVRAVAGRFGLDLAAPDASVFRPELYRRHGGGESRKAVFSRLRPAEMKLLAALRAQAHPLGAATRAEEPPASLAAASAAFLSEWAAARAAAATPAASAASAGAAEPPPSPVAVQVFAPAAGEYSEEQSFKEVVQDDGVRRDLSFEFAYDGSAPIRIDIGHAINVIEVRRLGARFVHEHRTETHTWEDGALSRAPVILGNSVLLEPESEEGLRILSLGDDAQLYLELRTALPSSAECHLDISLAVWTLAAAARDPRLSGWLAGLGKKLEETQGALALSERHVAALSLQLAEAGVSAASENTQLLPARVREASSLRQSLHEALETHERDSVRLEELEAATAAREQELRHLRARLSAEETARRGVLEGVARIAGELAEAHRDLTASRTEAARLEQEVSAWRTRAEHEQSLWREARQDADRLQQDLREAERRVEEELRRGRDLEDTRRRVEELTQAVDARTEEVLDGRARLAAAEAARAGGLVRLREGLRTAELAEAQLRAIMASPLLRARRLLLAPLVLWRIWRRHPSLRGRVDRRALLRVARTWDVQSSLLRRTDLIAADFYRARGADTDELGLEPALHYLYVGAAEGRDPHPLFDTRDYVARNPDVTASGLNPLVHYLLAGAAEGRDPHPLFDSRFYCAQAVPAAAAHPLLHYLRVGAAEGLDPHPLFDTSFYLEASPDVAASGRNPLVHYVEQGAAEGRNPNPWFDTAFYVSHHPEVAASGLNPLVHYLRRGAAAGLDPSPRFDASVSVTVSTPAASTHRGDPPSSARGTLDARRAEIARSRDAYAAVLARAREARAARIGGLKVTPPPLLSFAGDLADVVARIAFADHPQPEVSIVIPVWNGVRLAAECLESIARGTDGLAYEVIVFDNGSSDETPRLLPRIPNLVYLRSEENLGFGPGCNQAAAAARGRYIVFLNSDAQVTPGWLESLVQTLTGDPTVAAVGPKVLFPDGRLQEAGAGIGADATSTLVGLFDDPERPAFNRAREVDYVSGVCLLLETALFHEVGGFDPAFAPAYCEDVDLCLRLRARGRKVMFEPGAVVVHHLSASSNAMPSDFKVRCVTSHQQVLAERHQDAIDELNHVRLLAFYLPQFHPIPENDLWWGKGFTEWHNVSRARPNFEGHDQPRLPSDLGYYDLRLRETYVQQIELARRYGIAGFCMYYYWFGGKRLLERPLERLIEDRGLDFPFCVAWANENWTRAWDGRASEVLIGQAHDDADDGKVIRDVMRYFEHPSYIRVKGRPLFLVYRVNLFPDIRRTADIWREECRRRGHDVYLAMIESCEQASRPVVPSTLGFDASVEFPPHEIGTARAAPGPILNPRFRGTVYDYEQAALAYMARPAAGHARFRTVMPGWDNTARRPDTGDVFVGSTPGAYQAWLEWVIRQTREAAPPGERIVFINAWNEWAEGNYLEPDARWGHAYLEATRSALQASGRSFWP